MNKEQAAETLRIRNNLDSGERYYIYTEDAEETVNKKYTYVEPGKQLMRYSTDYVGQISDCYILYAIAVLGVADRNTVQIFLSNLKTRNPDLHIQDPENGDNIANRINTLLKCGFLFAFEYSVFDYKEGSKKPKILPRRILTIDRSAVNMTNSALQKRVPFNSWMQAKPFSELLGWGSAAYIGAKMSLNKNWTEYLDGVFRSKYLGTYYFPFELKYRVENIPAYVAILSAFLFYNQKTMTEKDFDEWRVTKINAIRNYIMTRSQKGPAYVVVVVQDNDDLIDMADLIIKTEILEDCLQNIYFTGEGAIREAEPSKLSKAFLKMTITGEEDSPYEFRVAQPEFMV